jgi:5-formyltetrahydrofolate cyclo-ligase
MSLPLAEAKAALRRELRVWLRARRPEERAHASAAARDRLRARTEWRLARGVLLYVPRPDELDLWPLAAEALARGVQLALPRFDAARGVYQAALVRDLARDLRPGRYGLLEPGPDCPAVPLNRLDLLLVPGLCFDREGRRLGRGGGHFDRLLTGPHGTACGVAWDHQVRERLPAGPEDQTVDCILTPTRWLAVARR